MEKIKQEKIKSTFAMLTLKESEPGKPLLLHDEPIYLGDKIIGRTTSGNYSFNFKKNLAFGYIEKDAFDNGIKGKDFYIEVEKTKYPADLLEKPLKKTDYKVI